MIEWDKFPETEDSPKMFEVYLEQSWQNAFCYALAVEEPEKDWMQPKLLMAIVSGSDSSLQSIKAAIDIGSNGLYFGHGKKGLTGYEFVREFQLMAEKGAYEKFPMSISSSRKALAIVHDDLLGKEYILSFDGDPAEDVRQLLGGGKYGLHILPEWKEIIFQELKNRGYLEEVEFYYDKGLFPQGFSLLKIKLEEEQADNLISELIRNGKLTFPKQGTGKNLENVKDLTTYMQSFVHDMIAKVNEQVKVTHNPLQHKSLEHFDSYQRQLFPVQAHVATAVAKRLRKQKSVIIQGEMSTGKTTILTAIADGFHHMKNKRGYFACVMVPPSLTKKWPDEIKEIIPDADVIVINNTEQLIKFHSDWNKAGRPKPNKPTFFVISFTTMRGDCAMEPAVSFVSKKTKLQKVNDTSPYRYGYICPDCGKAHQVIEDSRIELDENGREITIFQKRPMGPLEFGDSRRLHNSQKPANAFCSECGASLWTKRVPTRYGSFGEWVKHEKKIVHALKDGNQRLYRHLQDTQKEIPKVVGKPRRIAAIEYIRRRMKNFFDITLVDEIHELKGGMSAQGNSLGSLAAVSKRVVGGTGTLFGGKAEDVYYLLWRLFPYEMVKNGYKYSEVRKWNEEFGNIETTTVSFEDKGEYSNKQSRGGTKRTEKVLPGISPFIFGKFLVQNTVLVRLIDVWPEPRPELVNVPTILVDMDEKLHSLYHSMISAFEEQIHSRDDGHKLYLPMTETGISYPDNPFTYPEVTYRNEDGEREVIWSPEHLSENHLLPKEKKLQEIITGEISEGRNCIVYVRDTGSSKEGRDVRPRLKKVLEDAGAKVAILDTTTTATNSRSEWLKKKVEKEGYNVIIVSQELVKVGLDLLCCPTLIFYQFSWSLFTINQASRRSYRIGQNKECRLYYLAYKDTFQEQMAQLIAMKNKAASAINGDVSSDGLNAMLGDDGDLQSLLIKSIKKGEKLKGSTEEWVAETSERAREILYGIGKKKEKKLSIREQLVEWAKINITTPSTLNVLLKKADSIALNIEKGLISGFTARNGVLEVDLIEAFGMDIVADGAILSHLVSVERKPAPGKYDVSIFEVKSEKKRRKKSGPVEGQLAFSLFD
jgi:Helicase conserved C-terminal domain